jgi:hypothetical protein
MLTFSNAKWRVIQKVDSDQPKRTMVSPISRLTSGVAGSLLLAFLLGPAVAQGTDPKTPDPKTQSGDPKGEEKRRIDEFAEAARVLGGPAANPECVWLGRRVVNLLWRDDLDTAFRHLDLYDRFGCPSGHIQATFRCLVRLGSLDPKAAETLQARVHACWVNPSLQPAEAAITPVPSTPTARGPGTSTQQ